MKPSLAKLLVDSAGQFPHRPAVRFMGKTTLYPELNDWSNRLANALQQQGVVQGDRVALYCINSPQFMASYFAILKIGATVVPINLLLHPEEVLYLLKDSGSTAMIYHQAVEKAVVAIRDQLQDVKTMICIGDGVMPGVLSWQKLVEEADPSPVLVSPTDKNDIAALLYTGGTTGLPKGAMLTHNNLLANVDSVVHALHLHENTDIFITVLPMFHSFGATAGFLSPIAAGSTVVALPQFAPEGTCKTIQDEKATVFLGVPTMFAMMANLPENKAADLSSLRFCASGGAPMPVSVQKRFQDRYNVLVYEGYGPTECSPVVSVNPIGGKCKMGTVGLPIPNVEIEIQDNQGRALPSREIGEICVRGANVMKGYWKQPQETVNVFRGEWIRTGDLGFLDEEGYCTIVDRAKDLIIVHGINVYPRQVEDVLYQHPAVAEAAVIGIQDMLHGEQVKAYVSLKAGEQVKSSDLIAFCRRHLGRFEVPRWVEILESLPKSGAGKILRRSLRDLHQKGRASS
ncbi:MAG TPA: long-chain fatty acid--CoA ligase [bacterium]|nr:long-chain fatty acid--CoA ligase [bacterium]HPG44157.1 long-chain fatty acid--CoA ligase [bacterium]HPM96524.1 long-chain fatty acid--CoA ligase [bacterium]